MTLISQLWVDHVRAFVRRLYNSATSKAEAVPHTASLLYILKATRSLSMFIAVAAVAVFMPTYLIYKLAYPNYSNHTYNYGWILSVAFLQGRAPSVAILLLWVVLILIVHILIVEYHEQSVNVSSRAAVERGAAAAASDHQEEKQRFASNSSADSSHTPTMEERWRSFSLKSISAYFINCIVVFTANGIYVFVTLTQSASLGVLALVSLVAFKTSWNLVVVPILLKDWFDRRVWCGGFFAVGDVSTAGAHRKGTDLAHSLLLMFNNVAAPCLATACADSACFLTFFDAPAPIESTFSYPQCELYSGTGCSVEGTATITTSFNPPFIYSYQCSAALLTKYVPMFLLMFSFTGLVLPCLHFGAMFYLKQESERRAHAKGGVGAATTAQHQPPASARVISDSSDGDALRPSALSVLSDVDLDLDGYLTTAGKQQPPGGTGTGTTRGYYNNAATSGESKWLPVALRTTLSSFVMPTDADTVYYRVKRLQAWTCLIISGMHWPVGDIVQDDQRLDLTFYKARSITCNIMGSFAVLFTFGLAYPPLAVVIMTSIAAGTTVLRFSIQEALEYCPQPYFAFLASRLEKETYGLSSILKRSGFALLTHSALFCFFLLTDISEGLFFPMMMLAISASVCVLYSIARSYIWQGAAVLQWHGAAETPTESVANPLFGGGPTPHAVTQEVDRSNSNSVDSASTDATIERDKLQFAGAAFGHAEFSLYDEEDEVEVDAECGHGQDGRMSVRMSNLSETRHSSHRSTLTQNE